MDFYCVCVCEQGNNVEPFKTSKPARNPVKCCLFWQGLVRSVFCFGGYSWVYVHVEDEQL